MRSRRRRRRATTSCWWLAGNAKPGDTIEEAVAALRLLPERVHLALVGGGHEALRGTRRPSAACGDRVHLLAPVPPTEVASFIATADAAPILYRAWTVNFQHALPNRFFHAVAAGLPVLYPPLAEIAALCSEHELGLPIDPLDPGVDRRRRAARSARTPSCGRACAANVERAAREVLSWEREEQVLADCRVSSGEGGG